jgi:hypothetical protein
VLELVNIRDESYRRRQSYRRRGQSGTHIAHIAGEVDEVCAASHIAGEVNESYRYAQAR